MESNLQALILLLAANHPSVSWRSLFNEASHNTASAKSKDEILSHLIVPSDSIESLNHFFYCNNEQSWWAIPTGYTTYNLCNLPLAVQKFTFTHLADPLSKDRLREEMLLEEKILQEILEDREEYSHSDSVK